MERLNLSPRIENFFFWTRHPRNLPIIIVQGNASISEYIAQIELSQVLVINA